MEARAEIHLTWDIASIVRAAGSSIETAYISGTTLICSDATQKAVDDAITNYDHEAATAPDPKVTRDAALMAMAHSFGDGRVMQVRPTDQGNIIGEIDRMSRNADEPQSWRMVNNEWHYVTVADLQAALESGQDQGRVIWNQYKIDTQ